MTTRMRRALGAVASAGVLLLASACGSQPDPARPSPSRPVSPFAAPLAPREGPSAIACAALRNPIYGAIEPATGRMLLTASDDEARQAPRLGFTERQGVVMRAASATDIPDLVAIHRLSSGRTLAWAVEGRVAVLTARGFTDEGVNFYAATKPGPCVRGVSELARDGVRRYTADQAERRDLVAGGWSDSGIAFYVAADAPEFGHPTTVGAAVMADPDPSDVEFTFAAIPDSQMEVHSPDDERLLNRSRWLVANRQQLDLRFVVHVGDLVDWDTKDHAQYRLAQRGLEPIVLDGLPLFFNVGNHDGQAVCAGGSACDPRYTSQLVRMTDVFNQAFTRQHIGVAVGEFEPGKLDNTYTTMGAGGLKWLILNLELWPREDVIEWARKVVTNHPDYNVILTTHAFLNKAYEIDDEPNYGGSTAQQIYDRLVAPYPNVKIILSGHAGYSGTVKVLDRPDGTKAYAVMQSYHSRTTNPVRLITVNTRDDSITAAVTAPATGESLAGPTRYERVGFVRSR